MKTFNYTITDEAGMHARPTGLLVKVATKFSSEITISKGEKTGDCKKMFGIMGMGIKCGEEVVIKISGEDEDDAFKEVLELFESSL